jgi:hypothetical protein
MTRRTKLVCWSQLSRFPTNVRESAVRIMTFSMSWLEPKNEQDQTDKA